MRSKGEGTARFFSYILGKLLAVALAAGVVVLAFFTALATANVQVIVKDAFAKRASVLLNPIDNSDTELLDNIFTSEYLEESQLDTQQINKDYDITNYVQRTDVSLVIVLPWVTEVTVEVRDVVDGIVADIASNAGSEYQAVDKFIENGVYQVTLVKQDDSKWLVSGLELVEPITSENENPVSTPTPIPQSDEAEASFSVEDQDYVQDSPAPEGSSAPEASAEE